MEDNEIIATTANFQSEVLSSSLPVLVDFWAPWCAPCRMIAPVIAEIANEYAGKLKVARLNVDENQEISARYGVMSLPTLAFQGRRRRRPGCRRRSKAGYHNEGRRPAPEELGHLHSSR